jgi:hypothetical protein
MNLNKWLFGIKKFITKLISNYNKTEWSNYNKSEISDFDFSVLTVYEIENNLIRVGPNADGGYVIAEGFSYEHFISCGIANDLRFETAFMDHYSINYCLAFDGTIDRLPEHHHSIEWINKNIGYINSKKITNLRDYLQGKKNIFMKMDIEGSEFNWIDSMSIEELEKFSQIVIEIHWPFDKYSFSMLKKLTLTHYCVHIHGNNYSSTNIPKGLPCDRSADGCITINNTRLGSITLPEIFEITLVNKKMFSNIEKIKAVSKEFPTELDYPNHPNTKDINFRIPLTGSKL